MQWMLDNPERAGIKLGNALQVSTTRPPAPTAPASPPLAPAPFVPMTREEVLAGLALEREWKAQAEWAQLQVKMAHLALAVHPRGYATRALWVEAVRAAQKGSSGS